jgi:hypothetical protein
MKQRHKYNHLCLHRAYQSKPIEQEITNGGYVPPIPYKRKRGQLKEENTNQKRYYPPKINDGLLKEPTLGIIDSESCLQGMKRRLKITWVWCSYLAVSLFTER